jgi:hypothetical protein
VALAARVGDDLFGAAIVDELEMEGIDCKLVRRCPGKQSSVSAVMIDSSGERMIVNYKDPDMDSSTQTGFRRSCLPESMACWAIIIGRPEPNTFFVSPARPESLPSSMRIAEHRCKFWRRDPRWVLGAGLA